MGLIKRSNSSWWEIQLKSCELLKLLVKANNAAIQTIQRLDGISELFKVIEDIGKGYKLLM